MRRVALALAGALTLAASAPLGAMPAKPLDLAAMRRIVRISNVAIAPDGKHVAYVAVRSDFAHDRTSTDLFVVDVATRSAQQWTRERRGVGAVHWSPDSSKLAYITTVAPDPDEKGAKPARQIVITSFGSGDVRTLTHVPNGVNDYAFRPDGRVVAFTTADDAPNKKAIEAHDDAFDIDRQAWNATAAGVPTHLWTISTNGGTPHRLTSGRWSVTNEPVWNTAGSALYFTRSPDAFTNLTSRLARVDLATKRVHLAGTVAGSPIVASDGTLAALVKNPRAAVLNDFALSSDGGDHFVRSIAPDRNIAFLAFAPHGHDAFVGASSGTRFELFALHAGSATRIDLGPLNLASPPSISRDGTIAFSAATTASPPELYVLPTGSRAPLRLTAYNAFLARDYAVGPTRAFRWSGDGGALIDGVLTEPPSRRPSARLPLVLLIHGGPTSASLETFSELPQLLAARGWLVFQPNYRGSDNRGSAFVAAAIPHVASIAGRDILNGVDALVAGGRVDRTRIGVSGWSAGGWMTSWLITHDTRWRAAFSGAAVNEFDGVATMSDALEYGWALGGTKWGASEAAKSLMASESPLSSVANVRTPTLIVTDAGDYRVPTSLSYEFYHDVRATGTPVQLRIYPVDGHFPSDPVRIEDVYRQWVSWFAAHF